MNDSLAVGLRHEFNYVIPDDKTVPFLFRESPEFQVMPEVLATGFMVGLIEWTCIQAVNPHIDWPREQTVGTGVNLTHLAATPPGLRVTVKVALVKKEGRKLVFSIEAEDGVDVISQGTHERFVIDAKRFKTKTAAKAEKEHFTPY